MTAAEAIKHLKKERSRIKLTRPDCITDYELDEAACEHYGHLTDVIECLETGTMTVREAIESVGLAIN